jgi:hydroxyethylthiazole kinase
MSGVTDIVTDGRRTYCIENGHPLMGRLSGTGCMAASVTGAFAAVESDYLTAATAALTTFSIAGELAATGAKGPYSFRVNFFDTLATIDSTEITGAMRVRTDHAV